MQMLQILCITKEINVFKNDEPNKLENDNWATIF